VSSRCYLLIIARRPSGGAAASQVSVALFIGTVPPSVIEMNATKASNPAQRKPNPGPKPSSKVTAIPEKNAKPNMAGTKTRSLRISAWRNWIPVVDQGLRRVRGRRSG
jgi:hypothetical protein